MTDDPIRKIHDQMRRMTDMPGLSGTAFDVMQRATQISGVSGVSDHLRQITEIPSVSASNLEALRIATQPLNLPGLPDSMRQLIESAGAHAGVLGMLTATAEKFGLLANLVSPSWITDVQPAYSRHLEAMARLTESMDQSPAYATWRAVVGQTALTAQLNVAHSATGFATPAMQDALRLASLELPTWLKPAVTSDMLLPSWTRTAGIGVLGIANPGLIHDVLGALHRARPDTFAFDVAVTLAESFDQPGDVGAEKAADLLQKYAEALIALLVTTKDWVARQGIISMLSLILLIAATYDGHLARLDGDEQVVLARTAVSPEPTSAQKEIARQVETLQNAMRERDTAHQADRNIRAVIQLAPLRVAPDAKAHVVRMVYPDDRVRVQDVKGNWALIEVFDYKSEAAVTGWINRRVLRMSVTGG